MKRLALTVVAACLAGCTETLIGTFVPPTHELKSLNDITSLGVSLKLGDPANPLAFCAARYDREFAPWGEQWDEEWWKGLSPAFRAAHLDVNAIIDVDTTKNDFGQAILVWMQDRSRLKIFLKEQFSGGLEFPGGCRMFNEAGAAPVVVPTPVEFPRPTPQ